MFWSLLLMGNIKNKIIFCFICLIFYTALSLSFYLIPFNAKVLSIIAITCTTIFSVFFILPAFLYSPVYSIIIGVLHYILFRMFEIIRIFTTLDSKPVTLIYLIFQSAFSIIINIVGIVLTCLTIYFVKKYIKSKGTNFNINIALITAGIITFIKFIVSAFNFSSFFFSLMVNNITINNDLIIQQFISNAVGIIFTFIAVMISYFIYIKIKDKPFFSDVKVQLV